ncbi:hypothetical protein ACLIYN_29335, partial [Streptomyces atacamensis]
EPDAPRPPEPPLSAPPRTAPPQPQPQPQPAPRPRTPQQGGTAGAGAGEPYGQGSGSRGSGAPKRGGFDFFGTQGTRKRRRAPETQDPAAGSSEQEDDRGRGGDLGGTPGDGGPDDGSAPESTHPGTTARAASPAVAGKVIDLGEPGGDESEDGDSPPADADADGDGDGGGGTSRHAGPVRGLRRARPA